MGLQILLAMCVENRWAHPSRVEFPSIRHNTMRDITAHQLEKVTYGGKSEPHLLPVGNKTPLQEKPSQVEQGCILWLEVSIG